MSIIITVLLASAAVICAIGWLKTHISCAVLLWYIQESNIHIPNEEDIKKGSEWVISHMIKDLKGSSNKRQ